MLQFVKRRVPPFNNTREFNKRFEFASRGTDLEIREEKMQKWLDDLSSKFESDCTTSLQKSLKKIKTVEDITSKINIKLDILDQMVYFNILGRYLAIVELKSNPLKEFAEKYKKVY